MEEISTGEDGLGIAAACRRCLELLLGGVSSRCVREEMEGERESCGEGHALADLCRDARELLLVAGEDDFGRR